jgi:glucokinase
MSMSQKEKLSKYPRLVSDIGGTNARFAIEETPMQYSHIMVLNTKDHESLSSVIKYYLKLVGHQDIKYGVLSVPSPIVDDTLFMVNSPWHLTSIKKTLAELSFETLLFLNDFHSLVLSIPHLDRLQLVQYGGIVDNRHLVYPVSLIGPGTGLGMATLIKHPKDSQYLAVTAEGGRSSFAAVTEEEFEIWKFIHKRFHHVSVERVISGSGLQVLYEALCSIRSQPIKTLPTPEEITHKALKENDFLCIQVLEHFCRILGTISSNQVCMANSFGGVYIGGGIIPKILEFFLKSDFRCRFEDKGRFRTYIAKIPVFIIMQDYPAFLGASYALETYLTKGFVP